MVNIGSRQSGRARGKNVIDVDYQKDDIKNAILYHIEKYAKKILKKPPSGSTYSNPRARFHQDMSKE